MTDGQPQGAEPPSSCDLQVALQLAEQLRQTGQWELLIQYYRWAAAAFVDRAEPHNALAVYSLLSQLVPHCLHTHAMIAEQYRSLGDIAQTTGIYERIAHTHHAAGRLPEAAQVYRIVVELDPTHVPRRIALAELCDQLGYTDEAFAQLEAAAAQLKAARRYSEYLWTAHRMLASRPTDKATLRELAEVQLASGDVYGAVQSLRSLMAVSPRDDKGRELMAHAFAAQGQVQLACRCAVVLGDELRSRGYGSLPDAQRVLRSAFQWNKVDLTLNDLIRKVEAELAGPGPNRRGSHVRGEIQERPRPAQRRKARRPGVPEEIPQNGRQQRMDDEDTNVLPMRRNPRRTISYHQPVDGRVVNFRPVGS